MPKPICSACQHHIDRNKGTSVSVLCPKCLCMFHSSCFNPCTPNHSRFCSSCSALQPPFSESDPFSPTPLHSDHLNSPNTPLNYTTQLSIDFLPDNLTPLSTPHSSISSTSGTNSTTKRQRSSPPDQSQPSKIFCPHTSSPLIPDMAPLSLTPNSSLPPPPSLPPGTPDWAIVMFNHMSTQIGSLHSKFDTLTSRLESVKQELKSTREDVAALRRAQAERDTCEIRLSGIPANVLNDSTRMLDNIKLTLDTIKCPNASSAICNSLQTT